MGTGPSAHRLTIMDRTKSHGSRTDLELRSMVKRGLFWFAGLWLAIVAIAIGISYLFDVR